MRGLNCILQRHDKQTLKCSRCGREFISLREPERVRLKCRVATEQEIHDAGKKLGVTPKQVSKYLIALARWATAGFPTRSEAEVVRIHDEICKPCEHFISGRCNKCGCRVSTSMPLVNKIAMGTEACPEGKWQ